MHICNFTTAIILGAMTGLSLAPAEAAMTEQAPKASEATDAGSPDRLMIVNGNTGRVIYDDGYDDLYCVTRRVVIGYTEDGNPIFRRTLRCR